MTISILMALPIVQVQDVDERTRHSVRMTSVRNLLYCLASTSGFRRSSFFRNKKPVEAKIGATLHGSRVLLTIFSARCVWYQQKPTCLCENAAMSRTTRLQHKSAGDIGCVQVDSRLSSLKIGATFPRHLGACASKVIIAEVDIIHITTFPNLHHHDHNRTTDNDILESTLVTGLVAAASLAAAVPPMS